MSKSIVAVAALAVASAAPTGSLRGAGSWDNSTRALAAPACSSDLDLDLVCRTAYPDSPGCRAVHEGAGGDCWGCSCGPLDAGQFFGTIRGLYSVPGLDCCAANSCDGPGCVPCFSWTSAPCPDQPTETATTETTTTQTATTETTATTTTETTATETTTSATTDTSATETTATVTTTSETATTETTLDPETFCRERFSDDFEAFCHLDSEGRCVLNVRTAIGGEAGTCDAWCQSHGGVCVDAVDNVGWPEPTCVAVDDQAYWCGSCSLDQAVSCQEGVQDCSGRLVDGEHADDDWRLSPRADADDCDKRYWVQVDLGSRFRFNQVTLYGFVDGSRQYCGRRVDVSVEGFDVDSRTVFDMGAERSPVETQDGTLMAFDEAFARYVRVYSSRSTANTGVHFLEVDVDFEPPDSPPASGCEAAYFDQLCTCA